MSKRKLEDYLQFFKENFYGHVSVDNCRWLMLGIISIFCYANVELTSLFDRTERITSLSRQFWRIIEMCLGTYLGVFGAQLFSFYSLLLNETMQPILRLTSP